MRRRVIMYALLVSCMLVRHVSLHASTLADDSARFNISFTPQYILKHGLKTDFSFKLSGKNWMLVSCELYSGTEHSDSSAAGPKSTVFRFNTPHQADAINGYAISIGFREFLKANKTYSGAFGECRFNYSNLDISFQDNMWQKHIQDGMIYYHYEPGNGKLKIMRFDVIVDAGYAAQVIKNFHIDFSAGAGVRIVNTKSSPSDGYRNYTRNYWDYQYPGFHPFFVMDLGYAF